MLRRVTVNELFEVIKVIERNLDFFQHGFWVFTKATFTQDRFHLELYRLGLACVYMGPAGTIPNGTASHTQIGPLAKSIPFGPVPK